MNQIIEKKLLAYLHQLNCPNCGASLDDVSISIIDAPTSAPTPAPEALSTPSFEPVSAPAPQAPAAPAKVFQELDRLRALNERM